MTGQHLEGIRELLWTAVVPMIGIDFFSHLANLLTIDPAGLEVGFRGVEYGTPLYELMAAVYWGFAFVPVVIAVILGEADL